MFDDNIESIELSGVRQTRISGISKEIFLMRTLSEKKKNELKTRNTLKNIDSNSETLVDLEFLKNKNFQFAFNKEFNTAK